jgi:hypothetical protein
VKKEKDVSKLANLDLSKSMSMGNLDDKPVKTLKHSQSSRGV